MESDHDLEKILGVGLELDFKSLEPDWIQTPKKVTPLISNIYATVTKTNVAKVNLEKAQNLYKKKVRYKGFFFIFLSKFLPN